MLNNFDRAATMLFKAIHLVPRVPRERRPALGAAVKDLQQITNRK